MCSSKQTEATPYSCFCVDSDQVSAWRSSSSILGWPIRKLPIRCIYRDLGNTGIEIRAQGWERTPSQHLIMSEPSSLIGKLDRTLSRPIVGILLGGCSSVTILSRRHRWYMRLIISTMSAPSDSANSSRSNPIDQAGQNWDRLGLYRRGLAPTASTVPTPPLPTAYPVKRYTIGQDEVIENSVEGAKRRLESTKSDLQSTQDRIRKTIGAIKQDQDRLNELAVSR